MTTGYPVYRSPDGESEQIAATPAREVQLRFAGWRKVTQPRTQTNQAVPLADGTHRAAGGPTPQIKTRSRAQKPDETRG